MVTKAALEEQIARLHRFLRESDEWSSTFEQCLVSQKEELQKLHESPWQRLIHPFLLRRMPGTIQRTERELKRIQYDRRQYMTKVLEIASIETQKYQGMWKGFEEYPPNDSRTLIDLLGMSLTVDTDFRNRWSDRTGENPSTYWQRQLEHYGEDNMVLDRRSFIPAQGGASGSEEAYRLNQVQQVPEGMNLILLRTLGLGRDAASTRQMDFRCGDLVEMGPGLATSAIYPLWLGSDVLLEIEGVRNIVPMLGKWDGVIRQEGEVFIPDRIVCRVIAKRRIPCKGTGRGRTVYRLRVETLETSAGNEWGRH